MKEREHNLKLVDDNLKLKEFEKELEGLEGEKDSLSKALNEIVENESMKLFLNAQSIILQDLISNYKLTWTKSMPKVIKMKENIHY